MCCRSVHTLANPAYLSGLLFCGLLCVAPYCARGGVRVVSTSPSYRPNDHHELGVELDLGQPGNEPEQGAADEHDPIRHREVAGGRARSSPRRPPAVWRSEARLGPSLECTHPPDERDPTYSASGHSSSPYAGC